MKSAGTGNDPDNEMLSFGLTKLSLIDGGFAFNAMGTGRGCAPNPSGVLPAFNGSEPTAVSKASEKPSPSLSGPEPTMDNAAITLTATEPLAFPSPASVMLSEAV